MLEKFLEDKDIIKAKICADYKIIDKVQQLIGLKMGKEFIEYLLKFGFLMFNSVEFYGINGMQKENSDLIIQTQYLHKYFNATKMFYALENLGDGLYALIDSDDCVFMFDSIYDVVENTGFKFSEYVMKRFNEIQD